MIFEAELLVLIAAVALWKAFIKGALIVCSIDNNSARDVSISGFARNSCANSLLDKLVGVDMGSNGCCWYAHVPSTSNMADKPSKLEREELLFARGVKRIGTRDSMSSNHCGNPRLQWGTSAEMSWNVVTSSLQRDAWAAFSISSDEWAMLFRM